MNKLRERSQLMNKRVIALFLLLLPFTTDVVSATNRPGSSFNANVISGTDTAAPLAFTPEDIALCCTGNGDYGFMMRDLAVGDVAEFDVDDGFDAIPGVSLWTCRAACRDPANNFTDQEACFEVCDCRQGCPTTNDTLTVECRDACNFPEDSEEQGLCYEICHTHCGERCRSTFNGYVIPLELYGSALSILDCIYGDLVGEPEASCRNTSDYWEARGYTCNYTTGVDFDCVCDIPGTCPNTEYPCRYDFHCVSEAPSLVPSDMPSMVPSDVPSAMPSDVPSVIPSDVPSDDPSSLPSMVPSDVPSENPSASPSAYPTPQPTPRPTRGKGKGGKRYDDDDDYYYYDDDSDDDDDDDYRGGGGGHHNNNPDHHHDDHCHYHCHNGFCHDHCHDGRRTRRRNRRGRRRDRRTLN